jgi:enterochelin esterase-like enzyme
MSPQQTTEYALVIGGGAAGLVRLALSLALLACAPVSPPTRLAPAATATPARTPCPESVGVLRRTTVASAVYGAPVPISVYLPPCYTAARGPLPVVYLLHGGNADETQWPDVGVLPAADALIGRGAAGFIVVMPGGAYRAKLDYAAFVLHDLLPGVEQQFRVSTVRSGRAIGGISLGGYWALTLAFTHPELFAAAGGHSPVVNRDQSDDPLALAHTATGLDQLRVTLDVGDADALRADTTQLAQVLHARGLTVVFAVHPGRHDRAYWRTQTAAYLQFYLNVITGASSRNEAGTVRWTQCQGSYAGCVKRPVQWNCCRIRTWRS